MDRKAFSPGADLPDPLRILVNRNWTHSCIALAEGRNEGLVEGLIRHDGDGRFRPRGRPCRRFRRPSPGAAPLERRQDHAARVIGTSSSNSPILKSLDNAPRWRRCRPARSAAPSTRDGLPVYVLLCPQLYDRPGNPYGDEAGRDWPDNDIRFGRFASAAAELAAGTLDKNWAADLVHANDWQAALAPAYLAWTRRQHPLHPDHPQPRLSGPVPEGVAAADRRAGKFLPHRRARILRQAVLPQGRHRLRLAPDHRQRDLCQGDHDARSSAAGSKACFGIAPTPRN